jgi:hypothetical protein
LAQLFDEPEVREMLEEAQSKAKKRMATLTVRRKRSSGHLFSGA